MEGGLVNAIRWAYAFAATFGAVVGAGAGMGALKLFFM